MWWSSSLPRRAVRPAVVLALTLALGACFRPLYGATPSGVRVQDSLAAITVADIATKPGQERLGHFIRSELVFDLDGSGQTAEKRYRLQVDPTEFVNYTTTDAVTGRADAATLNVIARYTLTSLDGKREITTGISRVTATYFRDPQRFAALRAARDAQMRAAKELSEDIKIRLAAVFATSP